jgi:hypothetical protein
LSDSHFSAVTSIHPAMLYQRTLPAGFIAPCLPTKATTLPSDALWIHEIKHDGFRIIARKDGERVKLYSRPGNDLTYRFPLIVEALPACARVPASSTARQLRATTKVRQSFILVAAAPESPLSPRADMVGSCGIVESAGLPPDTWLPPDTPDRAISYALGRSQKDGLTSAAEPTGCPDGPGEGNQ